MNVDLLTRAAAVVLAIKAEIALSGSSEEVDAFLTAEGIVAPDPETLIPSLTERGMVWWAMLVKTPLPTIVGKWGDPRVPAPEPAIYEMREHKVRVGDGPTRMIETVGGTEVPPGFNPNRWPDKPAGFLPQGLSRDADLEVVRRSGRRQSLYAGSVIWLQSNKPDDVIAFRLKPGDALVVADTGAGG